MSFNYGYSYTGLKVGPADHVPTLTDVAVSLGRICRYAGNGLAFWTVLQHSMVVADMLPTHLGLYGLLHDSMESVISDVPRGFKNDALRDVEDMMYDRFLGSLGLPLPTRAEKDDIKWADDEALLGEVWTVGTPVLRTIPKFADRHLHTEGLVLKYFREYPPEECIRPDGQAVFDFQHHVTKAIAELKGVTK